MEGMMEGGGDLKGLLEAIIGQLERLEAGQAELRKTVYDDLIGGINGLYGENLRVENIGNLKSKHGAMFKDYEDDYKTLFDGDLYESLLDHLDGLKDSEGYDEGATVKEIADQLKAKIESIRNKPAETEAVEVEKEEPAEEEADPMDGVRAAVATLKKRGR